MLVPECVKYRPSSFYPVPFQSNLVSMLFTPPLSFNPICHQLSYIENVFIYLFRKIFFAFVPSLHGHISQSPKFGGRWGGDYLYLAPPPPTPTRRLALYCCESVWMMKTKNLPPFCTIVLFKSIRYNPTVRCVI